MRIGVDVGGSKLEAIAISESGEVLSRPRVPAPRGVYQDTIDAICGLVARIETETGRSGSVGIGIPGAISPATGFVKNANSTWLNGRSLGIDLAAALKRPVRLANDANCFALSEAMDGSAAGARIVFGVIIGTGTGGGVVIDSSVIVGANAIAGEWGHNPMAWPRAGEWPRAAVLLRSGRFASKPFRPGSGV